MSLAENLVDFRGFEAEVYREACRWGAGVIKKVLEDYDAHPAKTRDTSAYRHKGFRQTTVKTVMGEVAFRRAVYETNIDVARRCVYLLDQELGLGGAIGQTISHTAARGR
jgi:hypothetical protein